ncbi:MAG: hypothetical protein J6R08_01090 [Opitutales bacterium]|nr:hypothetical protein [Opitutales bacterium]
MNNEFRRGCLTPEIQQEAKSFLGREITVRELRLLPYIDYCLKNSFCFDDSKINDEERVILKQWEESNYITYSWVAGISSTKEFYDFMQRILWLGYVERKRQ